MVMWQLEQAVQKKCFKHRMGNALILTGAGNLQVILVPANLTFQIRISNENQLKCIYIFVFILIYRPIPS